MGLLSLIVGLPVAPVRGVVAVARALEEHAERELVDRSRIRRELEDAESAIRAGQVSAEQADDVRKHILRPLLTESSSAPPAGPS